MTEDLLKEDPRRLLLFSTSSDGDLRGWVFNPENVRKYKCIPSMPLNAEMIRFVFVVNV